jgi:hypothetical protein
VSSASASASACPVLHAPAVGYVYDTAYNLAADLRGNGRLYGGWNVPFSSSGYRPAELDRARGTVTRFLAPGNFTPGGDSGCSQNVQFSTNAGYFSLKDRAYVTLWSCSKAVYVVAADVDAGGPRTAPRFWKIVDKAETPSPYITDFGVHPATGRVFVLRNTGQKVREVFDVTSEPIEKTKPVLTVSAPSAEWDYAMVQLFFLDDQVCAFRSKDARRAHPQPDDLTCATLPEYPYGGADYGVPGMSDSDVYLPYVNHAIPVAC